MDELQGRSIALIGGAGFIGHTLALRLKALGARPVVLDSLSVNNYYHFKNNRDVIPSAEIYLGILEQRFALLKRAGIRVLELDARDYHGLSRALLAVNPSSIVHLAAVSHADKSNRDPMATFDHSLRTLENALDAARSPNLNISHFVYFSSSMVYGNFPSETVTEETPCEPIGIYGALKVAGERMVIAYQQVFGVPYTIVRPSALYGPRCVSRRVGQVFIENALRGLEITVQGDGGDRLDFTYIDDLVDGIVRVLTQEAAKNQTFNLTYGSSRSLADMARLIGEHFPEARLNYVRKDRLMPSRGTLSVEKAARLIGYRPTHPLEVGFVRYVEWYRSIWRELSVPAARSASRSATAAALEPDVTALVAGRVPAVSV